MDVWTYDPSAALRQACALWQGDSKYDIPDLLGGIAALEFDKSTMGQEEIDCPQLVMARQNLIFLK